MSGQGHFAVLSTSTLRGLSDAELYERDQWLFGQVRRGTSPAADRRGELVRVRVELERRTVELVERTKALLPYEHERRAR